MLDKISVIVPVYNREKQISRCLDSLLSQTYENIEIIVINDGSTDNSKRIIEEYKKEYSQKIVCINTKNQGVSEARNEGIAYATGEYIGFVDSDDYVDLRMYEKLYEKAKKNDLDLVACNTKALYPNKECIIDCAIQDGQNINKLLIDAYAVLWNKLYKAENIKKLRFKKDVWYEDVLFLYQLYPMLKKVGRIEDVCYFYVQNEGSITYTYNEKLYQLIDNMNDIINYYKKVGKWEEYYDELEYTYVRYMYGTFVKRLAKAKDKKKFNDGIQIVMRNVMNQFPHYKKNKYIKRLSSKSIYLKFFNVWIAKIIYEKEKNEMN